MAPRIYFAGSIRGGRDDVQLYVKILRSLQAYGTVLTEHVADPKLEAFGIYMYTNVDLHHTVPNSDL